MACARHCAHDCGGHILRVLAVGQQRDAIASFQCHLCDRQRLFQSRCVCHRDCDVPARQLAGGEKYDIQTSSISHLAAATKGSDAKKIAIGAGAGAAVGALLGGGGGAAKGAAIGGAGGTGVVLATRGKEVHMGPGADVTTKLTAPVTVRVRL